MIHENSYIYIILIFTRHIISPISMQKVLVLLILGFLLSFTHATYNPVCLLCHDIVNLIQKSVKEQPFETVIQEIALIVCAKKTTYPKNVCKGSIKEMIGIILNNFWLHHSDPHMVCPSLKLCSKEYQKRVLKDDIAKIMAGKVEKEWQSPSLRKTLKIMHISDLHVDLFYTVGAESKCGEPTCCRSNSTASKQIPQIFEERASGSYLNTTQNVKEPAGYWGSLNSCDLPLQTFDLFLKEVEKMDLDLILWTGDNTPHDIWQQSQTYNLNFTVLLAQRLKKHTKVRVIPSMGNHESFPVNVYDYQGDRESMLIGGLAEAWKQWLDQQAYDMLRTKGFFSIELPELNNVKIISLNTQAQNNLNFFLLKDSTDPGNMLQWLQKELKISQEKGQLVHIIGHIPPQSFVYEWAERFLALVDRYSYIIRGQFYGHTHNDQTEVFFSSTNSSKVINYCLLAPSLECGKNPQYRIMQIDYDTLQLVNYKQYMLDLRKYKDKEDNARFEFQYDFKGAYKLSDMTISGGITEFYQKMKTDEETQKTYWHMRRSELQPGKAGKEVFCDIMPSEKTYAECMGQQFKLSAFERLIGGWKDLKHKE